MMNTYFSSFMSTSTPVSNKKTDDISMKEVQNNGFFSLGFSSTRVAVNSLSKILFCYVALVSMLCEGAFAYTLSSGQIVRDINAHLAVVGVFTIIGGLFLTFLGFRLFKPMLFIAAWAFFGLIIYILVKNVEPSGGYKHRDVMLTVVPMVCGFVAACLILMCWSLAVSLLGALCGLALAFYIIQWSNGSIGRTARIVIMVVLPILGSILIQFFMKIMIIIATSFVGSYLFIFGIDCFVQAGFTDTLAKSLDGTLTRDYILNNKKIEIELGCMLIVFVIGMLTQFLTTRNRHAPNLDNKYSRRCCPSC